MNKIKRGQFFTKKNVFELKPFLDWWNQIPTEKKSVVLEPFAGANHIINSMLELNLIDVYNSFDIEPKAQYVEKRDTLSSFPKGYSCVVTNPPYLSKVSASTKKLKVKYPAGLFDLYEVALEKCLKNVEYVAAIIPESFITTSRFKDRVHSIISLTYDDMFSDTEHPVCLVMFNPEKSDNYPIYKNEIKIGDINQLTAIKNVLLINNNTSKYDVKFNVPNGNIHLLAVDNTFDNAGVLFSTEELVKSNEIKVSSRARTRISISIDNDLIVNDEDLNHIVNKANQLLKEYRESTLDVFMTSFKGLRKDGFYRRRLDFITAKKILLASINNVN